MEHPRHAGEPRATGSTASAEGGAALARIGVLGDIHAEDAALEAALRHLAEARVDAILAVGDIVDGPGSVDRCCELLREAHVVVVRGNHERWFLSGAMRDLPDATRAVGAEAHAFLAALPKVRRLATVAGPALLCHGLGDDDMASVQPDESERTVRWNPPLYALLGDDGPAVVFNGHSHRRLVWCYRQLAVINAGTLFREHEPCFLVADLEAREVTYFNIDKDHVICADETVPVPPARGRRE